MNPAAALKAVSKMVSPEAHDKRADPKFAAAEDKLAAIEAQLVSIRQERDRLLYAPVREEQSAALAAVILARLDGGPAEAQIAHREIALGPEMARLNRERVVLEGMRDVQKHRLDVEQTRVSREICARLRPQYVAIVRRMADAIKELGAVIQVEREFRERLQDASVSFSHALPPMPPPHADSYRLDPGKEYDSSADIWLANVREYYGV